MPSHAYVLAISTSSDYMSTCSSPGLQNHHEVQNSAVDELPLSCDFGVSDLDACGTCGGLKEDGPKGSGTIRECALFKEVCHCGGGL